MCGIWGIIATSAPITGMDDKLIKPFTLLTSLRGEHGTGYMSVNGHPNYTCSWIKAPGNCYNLWDAKNYYEWEMEWFSGAQAFFGHGRHATVGKHTVGNTHPFVSGPITLIHNGTIRSGVDVEPNKTDSEACAKLIAEVGIDEALNQISGAYVFIWHDDRDNMLRIVRNAERPLHVMEANGLTYFASEAATLAFIRDRELTATERAVATPITPLDVHTLYEYDLSKANIPETKRKIEIVRANTYQNWWESKAYTDYEDYYMGFTPEGTKAPSDPLVNPNAVKSIPAQVPVKELTALVGTEITFFLDTVYKVNGMWEFRGVLTAMGIEFDGRYFAVFRTSNKEKFMPNFLKDQVMEGTCFRLDETDTSYEFVITAKTVQPIDALDEEDEYNEDNDEADTLVEEYKLLNGDWIEADEWRDAIQHGCVSCLELIDDTPETANQCGAILSATGEILIVCPTCTKSSIEETTIFKQKVLQ